MWLDGRLTKIQATTRPENVWPEVWRKARGGKEKANLDIALRTRGIGFIDPRFAIVAEDLVICCHQGTVSPLRLLHGALVILVRLQISQFRSSGKWV